jgi:predicted permease
MGMVLLRAGGLILIMALGYLLKRVGFFRREDYQIVFKIVMNITLPCMIITSFADFEVGGSVFLLVLFGMICNFLLSVCGILMAGRRGGKQRAFNAINYSGYNIGCFTMPFIQSFLGSGGVVTACMFDIGNSLMCTGINYGIASCFVPDGEKSGVKTFFKKLFSSIPFLTYMVMLICLFVGFHIPDAVVTVTSVAGNANTFLAMLMIGMVFEFHPTKDTIRKVVWNVVIRYAVSSVFALIFYFLLPFSQEVRQVLVLVVFSPVSIMAPVFTRKLGCDESLAGVVNSICIPISILILTILLMLFPIS